MHLRELRVFSRPLGSRRLTGLAIFLSGVLAFYTFSSSLGPPQFSSFQYPWKLNRLKDTCTPQAYANGSWSYHTRTNATIMTAPEDALAFSGFERCAGSREYFWHLGADREDQYDRFPWAQSWEWIPGEGCEQMPPLDADHLVRHLVEDGGWYLVGDSVTENHFFSLSCVLYPHVVARPDYTSIESYDHGWPQYLYLSPSSPLLPNLSLPNGFNMTTTPLVTYRRVDILLSKEELIDIHRSIQPPDQVLHDSSLFSWELVWALPLEEYLAEFLTPLPKANYATMVVSTGGHWTTTLFSKVSPSGINGVVALFDQAMQRWAQRTQKALWEENGPPRRSRFTGKTQRPRKRAIVRAYPPGHESCHTSRKPWTEVQPFVEHLYNWGNIGEFNDIFERILAPKEKYPDVHYLPIDRPARLRPDAHATSDCLHLMAGAGVLEGWTHYIWQFVSRANGK